MISLNNARCALTESERTTALLRSSSNMNAHGVPSPLPGGLMNFLLRLSAGDHVPRPVLSTFLRMGDVAPVRSLGQLMPGNWWDTP